MDVGHGRITGSKGSKESFSLPLLDDVNELIEKEKLLLEFKLLDQQKEAFEWKAKYDSLLNKVSENILTRPAEESYRILEAVADNETVTSGIAVDISNLTDYIHKLGNHFILDMSNKSAQFVTTQISGGSKILQQYSSVLTAVYLRGCGLTDEHAPLLCSKFVSNPVIVGKPL